MPKAEAIIQDPNLKQPPHKLNPGREYKFQTFNLPRHPTRLYAFSLEVCKLVGFRDTYIFYLRNPEVTRVNGSDADREFLRAQGVLPANLKNRTITLVIVRDIFRMFGHKVIKRGRPWYIWFYTGIRN
jgi:Chromatin remodelling complex Rsc7/Swp82 subunit